MQQSESEPFPMCIEAFLGVLCCDLDALVHVCHHGRNGRHLQQRVQQKGR